MAVDKETILMTGAAGAVPGVVFDFISYGIQQWQRRRAGAPNVPAFGPFIRFILSFIVNFIACGGFAYVYYVIWKGQGDAYLFGGVVWLIVAIPILISSKYFDDIQKKVVATRVLGWLFKMAAAAASASYFIG